MIHVVYTNAGSTVPKSTVCAAVLDTIVKLHCPTIYSLEQFLWRCILMPRPINVLDITAILDCLLSALLHTASELVGQSTPRFAYLVTR